MTNFITVSNGIITGFIGGDINAVIHDERNSHERIELPANANVNAGDKISFYDKNWMRKPEIQLISEGLIPVLEGFVFEDNNLRQMTPEERIVSGLDELLHGFKIENNSLVPMTPVERIEAGIDDIPPGLKIENGELVPMTDEEKISAGLITREEIEIKALEAEEKELQTELDNKDYKVVQAAERGLVLSEIDPELHERREWCRTRINEIRARLAELTQAN